MFYCHLFYSPTTLFILLHVNNMISLKCLKSGFPALLSVKLCESSTKRTTFVLKRKYPIRLHKKDEPPKPFRRKEFIYELVNDENTNKKADIDVILTSYVEGLGQPGDQVSVRPYSGYEKVIVPGLAVYATPENIAKYAPLRDASQAVQHSSKYSLKTLKLLRHWIVGVALNDVHPWTLESWHMRVAFRQNGFIVPESAIEMPKREISGPDKSQHKKEFYVTVSISEHERVKVRCRIHLTGIHSDAVSKGDWIDPSEPLFEEDRTVLDSMPKVSELPNFDKLRIALNR